MASVSRKRSGFTVLPSPLNPVKLELGIILVVGLLFGLVVGQLVHTTLLQVLLLAVYGCAGMLWVIHRARRAVRRFETERGVRPPDA